MARVEKENDGMRGKIIASVIAGLLIGAWLTRKRGPREDAFDGTDPPAPVDRQGGRPEGFPFEEDPPPDY